MTAAPVVHRQPVLSHRPHAARPRPLRLPCTFRLPRMQPVGVVRLLGGQATAVQILAECSRRQLAASVRAGTVLRARRGVYVLPALLDPLQVAARVGGVSSHRSAAHILGYGLAEAPADVDVTVRHGDKPARVPGVRLHWARSLPDDDLAEGYTRPLRTVLDCATTLPFAQALAVADAALSLNDVTEWELRLAAARSPARGRARRRRVADAADGRAENPFESVLRALALEAGVLLEPQVPITLARRKVRVDLADRTRRLVVEADSYTHHGTRAAFRDDCDRYNDLVAAGWTVLRFTWEHVMLRPDAVRRTIRETVARPDGLERA